METMKTYTLDQWLLFFFIYCFVGWLWECGYVSVRTKKWTNRGFMRGPFLPIYGSGAIVILFTTLPVRNNPILVFVVSVISATILEFCTGTVMESMFKVRYWDYSRFKFNYKGYISLAASTAWGIGGTLLVFVVNRPVDALVCSLPRTVSELTAFALTVCVSCDFGASFKEAMDIRDFIIRISEEKDRQIKRLEKRVDVMAAVYGDELEKGMERIGEIKVSSQEFFKDKIDSLSEAQKKLLHRFINANPDAESKLGNVSEFLATLKKYKSVLTRKITKENTVD